MRPSMGTERNANEGRERNDNCLLIGFAVNAVNIHNSL